MPGKAVPPNTYHQGERPLPGDDADEPGQCQLQTHKPRGEHRERGAPSSPCPRAEPPDPCRPGASPEAAGLEERPWRHKMGETADSGPGDCGLLWLGSKPRPGSVLQGHRGAPRGAALTPTRSRRSRAPIAAQSLPCCHRGAPTPLPARGANLNPGQPPHHPGVPIPHRATLGIRPQCTAAATGRGWGSSGGCPPPGPTASSVPGEQRSPFPAPPRPRTHREAGPRRTGATDFGGGRDGGRHQAEGDDEDAQDGLDETQHQQDLQPGAAEAEVGEAAGAAGGQRAAGIGGGGHGRGGRRLGAGPGAPGRAAAPRQDRGQREQPLCGNGPGSTFRLPEDADGGSSLPRAGGLGQRPRPRGAGTARREEQNRRRPSLRTLEPPAGHRARPRDRHLLPDRRWSAGPPPGNHPAPRGPRAGSRREPRSGAEHPPREEPAGPAPAAGPVPAGREGGAGGYRRPVRPVPRSPGAARSGGRARRTGGRLRPSIATATATAAPSGMPGAAAGGAPGAAGTVPKGRLAAPAPGPPLCGTTGAVVHPFIHAHPARPPPLLPAPLNARRRAKEQSEPSFIP